ELFRVFALLENSDTEVYVDLNFRTGEVVGWSFPFSHQLTVDEASKALVLETLENNNFPMSDLQLEQNLDGTFVASNANALHVTDAIINVSVQVASIDGQPFVTAYTPEVVIPADYIAETAQQDKLAGLYTNIGFLGM